MKKKLLISLLLIMCFSVFANRPQDQNFKKNEIQLKTGIFPYVESVISGFAQINNEGEPIMLPVISAEYLRYINPKNGLGATFTIGTPYGNFSSGSLNITFAALQFTYRGIYMNKEKIKLYGEIGVGGELLFTITNPILNGNFAFHASPIGIWFGSEKIFGTMELTIGTEGTFATLGIGTRF